jgi:hypothetical protein
VHALPIGSGGLEHRASVTMDIAGLSFEDTGGYQRFADLAAHELFHAWNVKRIHDAALGPFDYTRECYTRLLWLYEGFTDYLPTSSSCGRASPGSATSSGCWPRTGRSTRTARPQRDSPLRAVVRDLGQAVQAVGELRQPLGQLLREGVLDRHGAGPRAAAGDGGRSGLPELLRRLWDRFGKREAPIVDADVRDAAAALAGRRMDRFFDRYIEGRRSCRCLPSGGGRG